LIVIPDIKRRGWTKLRPAHYSSNNNHDNHYIQVALLTKKYKLFLDTLPGCVGSRIKNRLFPVVL
jgi:hypothetical protein